MAGTYRKICFSIECHLLSERVSRSGWRAERSDYYTSWTLEYVASWAIDDTLTVDAQQSFVSTGGQYAWLYIEFPAEITGITRVEVEKRLTLANRFEVSEDDMS